MTHLPPTMEEIPIFRVNSLFSGITPLAFCSRDGFLGSLGGLEAELGPKDPFREAFRELVSKICTVGLAVAESAGEDSIQKVDSIR